MKCSPAAPFTPFTAPYPPPTHHSPTPTSRLRPLQAFAGSDTLPSSAQWPVTEFASCNSAAGAELGISWSSATTITASNPNVAVTVAAWFNYAGITPLQQQYYPSNGTTAVTLNFVSNTRLTVTLAFSNYIAGYGTTNYTTPVGGGVGVGCGGVPWRGISGGTCCRRRRCAPRRTRRRVLTRPRPAPPLCCDVSLAGDGDADPRLPGRPGPCVPQLCELRADSGAERGRGHGGADHGEALAAGCMAGAACSCAATHAWWESFSHPRHTTQSSVSLWIPRCLPSPSPPHPHPCTRACA